MIDIRIQTAPFDPGKQLARLETLHAPAVASVTALIPEADSGNEVSVEHYPAMAKSEFSKIVAAAQEKWPLAAVILIYRHGRLATGARFAFIAVAASEGSVALDACTFLATEAGRRAPFWIRPAETPARISSRDRPHQRSRSKSAVVG
jgi:molybdopterin synthase catalytic subunit